MSIEMFKSHFTDSNGELITELLITVDNDGDEHTRNKRTNVYMVLIKLLLDMDCVKTILYTEGDSKLHSVECYHVAENRAQSGWCD